MKNVFRMILCMMLVFSMTGCGNLENKTVEKSDDNTTVEAVHENTKATEPFN